MEIPWHSAHSATAIQLLHGTGVEDCSTLCVALAPSVNSPEPLWYVGCRTMSGEDKLFHTQTFFEINYPELARWTKSFPNAPQSCFVTFGQNLAYFASARGHGSVYGGIPSELQDKVQKTVDNPSCVALGAKNAWFVLYPDGHLAWKFHGHYGGLNKILIAAAPGSVSYVALSPYNKEHYFIAFRDKSIKYNFTGAPPEWMKLMTEVFDAWAADRLQKQPQPFFPPNPSPYPQSHPYPQAQPYPPAQPYPSPQPYAPVQPWQQPQPYAYGRPQSFYQYGPPQELASNTMSPPMTPNSPLPLYTSHVPQPAVQPAVPLTAYGYTAPQGGAIEMPAELPGDALLTAPAPAPMPVRSASTEKKKKFLSRLF